MTSDGPRKPRSGSRHPRPRFDHLSRSELEEKLANTREERNQVHQLIENLDQVLWLLDARTEKVLYVSPHLEELWGRPVGVLYADHHAWVRAIHPEDRAEASGAVKRLEKGKGFQQEYRIVRPDGTVRWVRERGFPVHDEKGWLVRFAGVVEDIHERKQAEEDARLIREALARSNADLEQFAYAISHDLQEPLRGIGGCLDALKRRLGEGLEGRDRELMEHAVGSTRRMQALIQSLLQYSRLSTRARPFTMTSLDDLLDKVLADLSHLIQRTGAEIERSPLPRLPVDGAQIRQLLQNLISNGLKFQPPGQTPRITISARRYGGSRRITVEDNGIGIDPEEEKRIFEVFQRLHRTDEYEGTGIGLALCKRIVERHSGHIWFDSTPGEGTAFHFTIPEAPSDASIHSGRSTPGLRS